MKAPTRCWAGYDGQGSTLFLPKTAKPPGQGEPMKRQKEKPHDWPHSQTSIEKLLQHLAEAASDWNVTNNPISVKQFHDAYHQLRAFGWDEDIDTEALLPEVLMPEMYRIHLAEAQARLEAQRVDLTPDNTLPPRILVIVNNPDKRIRISGFLNLLGYAAWSVRSVNEGLKALSEQRPALILLDLRLPDMSPIDMLTALRQQAGDVPILALRDKFNRTQLSALKTVGIVYSMITPEDIRLLLMGILDRVNRQLRKRP